MTAPAWRRSPDGILHAAPPAPTRPRFYTATEVATLLRISKMSVYRREHEWGAVRVGRLLRYPAAVIDALIGGAA